MPRPKGWKPKPKEPVQPAGGVNEQTKPVIPSQLTESTKLPFRKLWELQQKYGAVVKDNFNREELESKLAEVGYVDEGPKVEYINDYWEFLSRNPGRGEISAVDKAGDFSATVFPDGRCEIIKHTAPNRLARVPGIRYADETIKIQNLEQFASMLTMLINETDLIFDEAVETVNREQREWEEKSASMQSDGLPSIHGADPRIEQMYTVASEFGLEGPHGPSLTELPFKLADSLGVPLRNEDGTEKDWQQLSDEVIVKADIEDYGTGPKA